MTDHEAKAREIVAEFKSTLIDEAVPEYFPKLVSAIATALEEVAEAEREACAKIAENDDSFMMLQDFGLQSVVTQKGQNIAAAIRGRSSDD